MKPAFNDYFWAAFNARPIGMFVPPNWIGIAAMGLLGVVNPGFWLLGAGLELGYLYTLISSTRFRKYVQGLKLSQSQSDWVDKQRSLLRQLPHDDQVRYATLEKRCQRLLAQQRWNIGSDELRAQSEGLGRLLWIYLRLLITRYNLNRMLEESEVRSEVSGSLEERIKELETRRGAAGISENLAKSLTSQIEILQQRLERQNEGKRKLEFMEAELTRIQEQVELIREQAVVTTDPGTVSTRIDQVAASLGGTTQWISEQQQLNGRVEDLLAEPPPIAVPSTEPERHESQSE